MPTLPREAALPEMLGRYRVVERLAVGGMAEIFLARMTSAGGFEKNVVIKRIRPQLAGDDELYRMFVDEARIAALLQHPHIVQVYDCGEVEGVFFIAMEYLDGADLQTLRGALAQRRKGLPLLHTIHIASAVAAGLHYAHELKDAGGKPLGIVHRDVTPANVFLTRDGGIKLLDFGIAKAANRLTKTTYGTLKGKVAYMSPEQVAGLEVDRRSDVYSLGVLLYEMTTGRRLHGGKSSEYETLKEIVEGQVPRPSAQHPRYPAELEAIVLKALAKDREQRYQSARELGQALDGFARERRLMVTSIGLAEYLAPVLIEAKAFSDRRSERMRSARLSGALPRPSTADERAVDQAVASLVAEADASGASRRADLESEPPGSASDPDDPMGTISEVQVDLSEEQLDSLRLRPRSRWRTVAIAAMVALALAVVAIVVVELRAPAAPPAAPPAPRVGSVRITSAPAGAEVWLSLGRAPVDSPPLDPEGRYRVRVEHEGYQAVELGATPSDFRATPNGPVAELTAELTPTGDPAPAAPATTSPSATVGFGPPTARLGRLRIGANRAAAAVWLYLGQAPLALAELDGERRYELKVAAADHAPYFRVLEPRDFAEANGPIEISAALRELPREAKPAKRRKKKGTGRTGGQEP